MVSVFVVEGEVFPRVFLVEDAHVVLVAGVFGFDFREEVSGGAVRFVEDAG